MKPFLAAVGFLVVWAGAIIAGFAVPLFFGTDVSALGYSFVIGMGGALFGPLIAIAILRPRLRRRA